MRASESSDKVVISAESPQSVPDVGVLFVHGIGRHEAGATLGHMGGALASYAQQRWESDPEVVVDVAPAQAVDNSTASLLITFRTAEGPLATWRMNEARWDESFDVPTIGDVARWGLVIAPWVLHREAFRWWARRGSRPVHEFLKVLRGIILLVAPWLLFRKEFRQWFRREGPSVLKSLNAYGWRLATFLVRFIGFTVAGMGLQLLVLLSLTLVWIRPVRRMLDTLMVRTIGDAYRFITDPAALSTMSTHVAEELHRLSACCHKVIVVAHSQGAAVARAAIELGGPPSNLETLFTLGAGLTKLHAVQELRHRRDFLIYWTVIRLLLMVLFVLMTSTLGVGESISLDLLSIVLLVALFAPMRGVARGSRRTQAAIERTPGLGTAWGWLDLWSSRDLVPDGFLRARNNSGQQLVTSLVVDNSGSWLSDHVTYLSNPGQVLPLIYGVMANGSGLKDPTLVQHLRWISHHRARRATVRGRGLVLAPFVGVALLLPILSVLQEAGEAGSYLGLGMLLISIPIWSRLWKRWESQCRRLEPRGFTVPAGPRELINPWFWRELPSAPPPPEEITLDKGEEVPRISVMTGALGYRATPVDVETSGGSGTRFIARPGILILASLLAFASIAAAALPGLSDLVSQLSRSGEGSTGTAIIARALLEPWVVAFAVAAVILPGIVLEALGELSTISPPGKARHRLSAVALAASLTVAAAGMGASVILSSTVRPIASLIVGDCFDSHPADPRTRPDEQAHFDVVRIPCHELHEAEVVAMDPLDEDAFPLPGAPVEIARDSCGISAEIGAAEVGAVAALLSARVVDTNAFVPRGSDALGNGEGGVYCFVAARRCESALVGRIAGAGEIRQRSEPVEGCFNDDRFVIHENGSGPDPATLEESYQRVDL